MTHKLIKTNNYLLVVDDSEIKNWYVDCQDSARYRIFHSAIMFPSIDAKNITAHLPLNGAPILQGVDLLPPYSQDQEDGLEEYEKSCNQLYKSWLVTGYKSGYNKAREKYKYTEEDVRKAITMARELENWWDLVWEHDYPEILQSLLQYPTEFETNEDYTTTKEQCILTIKNDKL